MESGKLTLIISPTAELKRLLPLGANPNVYNSSQLTQTGICFQVPDELCIQDTFYDLKRKIHELGGPNPQDQRLELSYTHHYVIPEDWAIAPGAPQALPIVLKDDETFETNLFMRKHVYANDILTAEITIDKYFPTALCNDVIVLPPPIAATKVKTQTWNITLKRWVANDARKNVADNDFK